MVPPSQLRGRDAVVVGRLAVLGSQRSRGPLAAGWALGHHRAVQLHLRATARGAADAGQGPGVSGVPAACAIEPTAYPTAAEPMDARQRLIVRRCCDCLSIAK
eukprot:776713-Prymnesium_polylepis.1